MDANPYPLKQVLLLERRFVVPTFQRDYEWTREGQWQLLFDDLEAVASRLRFAREQAEEDGSSVAQAEKQVAPHFLGAVVLDQLPAPGGGVDVRAVIDGQQRLTTLQLLLRGILDVLLLEGRGRAKQVRRMIENPDDVVETAEERHKLWPRRRDRDAWRTALADDPDPSSKHVYLEARRYFATRTRSFIEDSGFDDSCDLLVDALLSLFKIVVIDLEDNDDAQVIFEVLNGRQTPLAAADLVKNLLFLRAEIAEEEELEVLYATYWARFDDEWWKKEVGRGHAARRNSDMLLASWLTAASGQEANTGRLYGQIRAYLDSSDRKVADVLAEISEYASNYLAIQGKESAAEARLETAYDRLRRLSVTTAFPLLLWLRALPDEKLSAAQHVQAVVAIESWILRRSITGVNTRGYGLVFREVLEAARRSAANNEDVAVAIEQDLLSAPNNRPWPTDAELVESFTTRRVYNVDSQQRIRMLLGALDRQLLEENPLAEDAVVDYDSLSIEHVMPRSWQEHWNISGDSLAERELNGQERDRILDRIGNLTLVTSRLNPTLSNGSWETKREALAEHSGLRLTASIVSKPTWDEETIEHRAEELARIAARVWPRPPEGVSDPVNSGSGTGK